MRKKQDTQLRVEADMELLPFLIQKMACTRTTAKGLLSHRRVAINSTIQTRHDTPLHTGDSVTILAGKGNVELRHPKLRMCYEDDHLLVVEKKQGLLTVPVRPESSEMTVFSILKAYVRRQSQRNGIYTVHRLDRETSGLLVFAKSPELQEYMRTYWRDLVRKRTYVALVEGVPEKPEGKITTWLTEDKRNAMVYSSPVDDGGDIAITNYRVIRKSKDEQYSLVELNLETGRTNQIRVHMASIGHPVVGDRKYGHGNESSPIDRLCLHARILEFIHPATEQVVHFETPVPREFQRMVITPHQPCE